MGGEMNRDKGRDRDTSIRSCLTVTGHRCPNGQKTRVREGEGGREKGGGCKSHLERDKPLLHAAAQYGMVWHGMVWYGMVWYGMAWHGMVC